MDLWSIDEIIVLDITRNLDFQNPKKNKFFKTLENISKNAVVPLTVGGGIRNTVDINRLLNSGADKVVVNSICLEKPKLINLFSNEFGSQCIVASIDVKKVEGSYYVFSNYGSTKTKYQLIEWINIAQEEGVGEIFLQSINMDGSLEGYDYEMVEKVSNMIKVPLIISSGAGNWEHFENLLKYDYVSGASTTNIYHFTESSIKSLKKYLINKNFEIRE